MFAPTASPPSSRRIILPLAAGLLALLSLARGQAQAQSRTYVVSSNDGYGVVECLADGVVCGKVVADSWCEAHGAGAATAYGLASDVTGALGEGLKVKLAPDAVIIACSE